MNAWKLKYVLGSGLILSRHRMDNMVTHGIGVMDIQNTMLPLSKSNLFSVLTLKKLVHITPKQTISTVSCYSQSALRIGGCGDGVVDQ